MFEHFITHWGYLAIFILTVAESACVPIPSEVTLGLGGALASGFNPLTGAVEPHPLNLVIVILVGVVGSLAGSFLAYGVGRTGGRAFVDRFGKYLLLTHHDLDRGEAWFARRGEPAVVIGRVVPVVRTFISFPAGMAEMNLVRFGIFTTLGVTVWVGVLSGLGYALSRSYSSLVKGFGDASYVVAGVLAVALAVVIVHRVKRVRAQGTPEASVEDRAGTQVGRGPTDPD